MSPRVADAAPLLDRAERRWLDDARDRLSHRRRTTDRPPADDQETSEEQQ